jgi:hypothetical protein
MRQVVIFVFLMLCTFWARADEPGNCSATDASTRPDCPQAIAFFEKLQAAVRRDARDQVADMVSFPIRTTLSGKRVVIRARQQFLDNYDRIFTPAVRCALLHAAKSSVWGRDQGFTFADGAIWWDAIIPAGDKSAPSDTSKFPMKVISVNNQGVSASGCPAA